MWPFFFRERREQLEFYVLIKQLADERAWSRGGSAGKNKVCCQLHAQAFVGKYFFVTYLVMV